MDFGPTNIIKATIQCVSGFSFSELFPKLWELIKWLQRIIPPRGIYEVLEYESILELKDSKGEFATFQKREKVRYLQDNVIAYQDQAWGDGEILIHYKATPGMAVDFYRPGQTTYILIALQNGRNFGDRDEFNIQWEMKNCFLRGREQWQTAVDHRTRRLRLNIIFPVSRPPQRVMVIEKSTNKATLTTDEDLIQGTDDRWLFRWDINEVRQHEVYILQWDW